MRKINVFINAHVLEKWMGYRPSDTMVLAFSFEAQPPPRYVTNEDACEWVFHLSNAPDEMLDYHERELARLYRARGLASLSVGDVVEVDGARFACGGTGWTELK